MTSLFRKRVKTPKKSVFIDHILLKVHNANIKDFIFLLKENIEFELHFKEYFLMKSVQSGAADFFFFFYCKKLIHSLTKLLLYYV